MIVDPHYWLFEDAIPEDVCEVIINQGNKLEEIQGIAGGKLNKETRASRIGWFPGSSWVTALLYQHVLNANEQAWRFQVSGMENVQFTKYGLNEHYDLHEDTFSLRDGMRKLSLVAQLSDPKDYKGGEFQFMDNNGNMFAPEAFLKRGAVIVFPSFLQHKVTPVTSGQRYSAVAWATGNQFR